MKPELVSVKFGENSNGAFVTIRINLSDEKVALTWIEQVIEAVGKWRK